MKTMLDHTFWNDRDFDRVDSIIPLAVYLYLTANENCNTVGCYRLSARKAMSDTRLDSNQLAISLELLSNGMEKPKIMHDPDTGWIWVRGLFDHNSKVIRNANIAKNVIVMIDGLESKGFPFMVQFVSKYAALIKLIRNQSETVKGKGEGKGEGKGKETVDIGEACYPLTEEQYKKHPLLKLLYDEPQFRRMTLRQFLDAERNHPKHMNWDKATEYVLREASLQVDLRAPAKFLDTYWGIYETDHATNTESRAKQARRLEREITAMVDVLTKDEVTEEQEAHMQARFIKDEGEAAWSVVQDRANSEGSPQG